MSTIEAAVDETVAVKATVRGWNVTRSATVLTVIAVTQLTWFGAYDLFGANDSIARATFHRAELRLLRDLPRLQFGAALQLAEQVRAMLIGERLARDAGIDVERFHAGGGNGRAGLIGDVPRDGPV